MSVILHLAGRIVTPLTCQHPGPFSKSRFSLNIDKQYMTDLQIFTTASLCAIIPDGTWGVWMQHCKHENEWLMPAGQEELWGVEVMLQRCGKAVLPPAVWCWLQSWPDRAPGSAGRAPGLEISFVLHQLSLGLWSSIIPAHCSQLISKGICLLRPTFLCCFCSLYPFWMSHTTELHSGQTPWGHPQFNCLVWLYCTFCFLIWKWRRILAI